MMRKMLLLFLVAMQVNAITAQTDVAPLLKTAWGQGEPYNIYCPAFTDSRGKTEHTPAGCGVNAVLYN